MFNSDNYDFLKGGLMRVGLQGINSSNGAIPTAQAYSGNAQFLTSLYTAYGASNCNVVGSSVATVFSVYAINASAAAGRFLQLHNVATVVASGAVPKLTFAVPAAPSSIVRDPNSLAGGQAFTLGVVYAWSSTPFSFTPVQGGDLGVEIRCK